MDDIRDAQQEDPDTRALAKTFFNVLEYVRARVLYEYHDSAYAGHPGAEKTLQAIREFHQWPRMARDVREHVKLCHMCTCMKAYSKRSQGLKRRRPTEPWDTVVVDLMGPYPMTGGAKALHSSSHQPVFALGIGFPSSLLDRQKRHR